ncbi:BTB/POZ/MATH-domain protein [Rhynchospora pubera]|uniref:BTB/POZ/MATH-domain protein n=1 Tax=Rhynchospora pubera TaxID=906938 RepID=A0AAV8DZI4_9POAL|nr:BTB/POZ/MATH-domain protein [Rhynchospora pubera]
MEVATGSHQLKITNYSQTKLIGVGMHFASGPFSVGGCTWAIHYYPGGAKKFHESYISLGLSLCHGPKTANVLFKFTLLDCNETPLKDAESKLFLQTFSLSDVWAVKFMKKEMFEASDYLKGDSFIIHYMISDDASSSEESWWKHQQLLVVSDRFRLDRMKLTCEFLLCKDLDVDRLSSALVLAEQHNCKQLKAASLKYITSQRILIPVMATDGFKHLIASCPWMLQEINASYSHETTNDEIRFGLSTLLLALCVLWIVAMYFALLFGKI